MIVHTAIPVKEIDDRISALMCRSDALTETRFERFWAYFTLEDLMFV
jgi:hypothetical protein